MKPIHLFPVPFRLVSVAAVLLASGCGARVDPPIDLSNAPDDVVIDVLSQSNDGFRRYHVVREVVWRECGSVTETSFAPSETQVSMLGVEERKELYRRLGSLLVALPVSEDFPPAARDERNVIQLSVRQNDRLNSLRTPSSVIRPPQSAGAELLAKFVKFFLERRDLSCTESGS